MKAKTKSFNQTVKAVGMKLWPALDICHSGCKDSICRVKRFGKRRREKKLASSPLSLVDTRSRRVLMFR